MTASNIHASDKLAQVVPQESARLNLGGRREQTFSIAGANHRTVCKFASPDNQQYRQVAAALEDLAKDALTLRRKLSVIRLRCCAAIS